MAVLPSLIRKLRQVGLNVSECCAYQKEERIDMVQNRLNPNEYMREKHYNL